MNRFLKWVRIISIIIILSGVFLCILRYKLYFQVNTNKIFTILNSNFFIALIGLIGVYTAARFSWRTYLKQKQVEEIREFYIKKGIDKVIGILDKTGGMVIFNFSQMLTLLSLLE